MARSPKAKTTATASRPKKAKGSGAPRHAGRSDDGTAFMPDPGSGPARMGDALGEELAEDFIASATSAENVTEDEMNALVTEEVGGPFVPSTAAREYDHSPDASNPLDAEREALPSPVRGS